MKRSRSFTPQWKKATIAQPHLDVIWTNGLGGYSTVINLGGLVALFLYHLILNLHFIGSHNIFLSCSTCSHWLSWYHYLSAPSVLSPSHVFVLFCGVLCYDKSFTPRMYVNACVMPLWCMGALTALPAPPGLPFTHKMLEGGAETEPERVIPPDTLFCHALMLIEAHLWTHALSHTHTRIYPLLLSRAV